MALAGGKVTFPAGKFQAPADKVPLPAGKPVNLGRILTQAGKKSLHPAGILTFAGGQEAPKMRQRKQADAPGSLLK